MGWNGGGAQPRKGFLSSGTSALGGTVVGMATTSVIHATDQARDWEAGLWRVLYQRERWAGPRLQHFYDYEHAVHLAGNLAADERSRRGGRMLWVRVEHGTAKGWVLVHRRALVAHGAEDAQAPD